MLRMIDRHAVKAVVTAGRTTTDAAEQFGISPRTVQRIMREGEIESADEGEAVEHAVWAGLR